MRTAIEILKRISIILFIVSTVNILLDLYVPLKRWIIGDQLSFSEILESIKYWQHFLFIMIVSIIVGLSWFYNDKQSKKS